MYGGHPGCTLCILAGLGPALSPRVFRHLPASLQQPGRGCRNTQGSIPGLLCCMAPIGPFAIVSAVSLLCIRRMRGQSSTGCTCTNPTAVRCPECQRRATLITYSCRTDLFCHKYKHFSSHMLVCCSYYSLANILSCFK